MRVDPTTRAPIDAASFAITNVAQGPAIAVGASNALFVSGIPSGYGYAIAETQIFDPIAHASVANAAANLGTVATNPQVAFDGTHYYAVWAYDSSTVRGARVDATTGKLVQGETVHTLATNAPNGNPVIAFDGTYYFVVWVGARTGPASTISGVFGERIDPATGAPLAADGSGIAISSNATSAVASPAIAFAAGHYLVTWTDYRNDFDKGDIYGALVVPSPSGDGGATPATKVGGDLAISVVAGSTQSSSVVADPGDGLNFQVVWQDDRNGSQDIYGALVAYDGTVRDVNGLAIANDPNDDEIAPAVASQGGGTMLVAYQRYDESLGAPRARARFLSTGLVAAASMCTSDDDCATRFCADGYCCDRACDGPCLTCSATPGTCTAVTNAPDSDTCAATCPSGATSCQAQSSCNAAGACALTDGQGATSASTCLSGFVSGFVCCDQACTGGCATCTAPGHVGTCTPLVAGSNGVNGACVADGGTGIYCDGVALSCPGTCSADHDCPSGEFCNASKACQTPLTKGACNLTTDCATSGGCGECALGTTCAVASCDADAGAASVTVAHGAGECVATVDLQTTSCEGFGCNGTKCKSTCENDADCANGFTCNTSGTCIQAAVCSDGHTAQDPSGATHDCSPYVCSAGACAKSCASIDDCVNGYACNAASACVATEAPVAATSSGCSCGVAPAHDTSRGVAALALATMAVLRRRRRAH